MHLTDLGEAFEHANYSTVTKLMQKIDHFTVFESFPSTSCCSQKFLLNKIGNFAGWMCKIVSGMLFLGGCRGWIGGKGYS